MLIISSFCISPICCLTVSTDDVEIRQIGAISGRASSFSLTKDGRVLYFVDETKGLRIFDVSDPVVFDKIDDVETPGTPKFAELSADDSTLFVADGRKGLSIFDVHNPRVAVLLSTKTFDEHAHGSTTVVRATNL